MLRRGSRDRHDPGAGLSAVGSGGVSLPPPLEEVPLPAPNAASLLRRNAADPASARRPALLFGDEVWSHAELLGEAKRFAALFESKLDPRRPPNVAVLLDNVPEYVFALCGAALVGATVVGLNYTRRGEHLARDISHTDAQFVITEPRHEDILEAAVARSDLPGGVLVSDRLSGEEDASSSGRDSLTSALDAAYESALAREPVAVAESHGDPGPDTLWVLLFTSGTSAAPKAVKCTQRRILTTGSRMATMLQVGPDDVGYAAMPLFHTNSLMAGLAPALVGGAALSLARRFSASGFLPDVRRYGATWFNYTGKILAYLLATPERDDDADNPLRIAFGNEGSPSVTEAAAKRFGIRIIDVFGSTEGSIALDRTGTMPRGSVGRMRQGIQIVDASGSEVPAAIFDPQGRLLNAEECVGEIVNTLGVGPFEGYYKNDEAMDRATRHGWYWSGDLGYRDDDGWVYFAGRTSDWLRVDGENFPAAPVEAIIARHRDVALAAVYAVPDAQSGDQVMVALVLEEGSRFDPASFAAWVDGQADMGPKWRPRFVRICSSLPMTPTNKVLTRTLVHEKFRPDRVGGDEIYWRRRGEDRYRAFGPVDEESLRADFRENGRIEHWDL